MKHRAAKIMSFLLSLVLIVGLMPGMSLATYATDVPYATLKNTTTVVKFDDKDWYLIDYDGSSVTLLSKECVGSSAFNENSANASYSGSIAEQFVNKWYAEHITQNAKKAVINGEMFLLTYEQANALDVKVLYCSNIGDIASWWLCTPGNTGVMSVYSEGYGDQVGHIRIDGRKADKVFGIRPALKLNPSSVIFDSNTNTFAVRTSDVAVTDVSLNKTSATLTVGSTEALTATVSPAEADQTVTWSSSDTSIATVDNTGKVTAVGEGTATITATSNADSTKFATCTVTVSAAADKYTVTYDANNGTDQKVEDGPHEAGDYVIQAYDQRFTAPEGKVFDCWQGSDGGTYKNGQTITLNANLTLTAQWKDKDDQDGGRRETVIHGDGFDIVLGGGFGSNDGWYDDDYAPQRAYKVSLAPMANGAAALAIMSGESTTTEMYVYPTTIIYVFPTADPGYQLDKIIWSLIDGSASYDITEARNFVMPAMDVVVYVTFKPLGA